MATTKSASSKNQGKTGMSGFIDKHDLMQNLLPGNWIPAFAGMTRVLWEWGWPRYNGVQAWKPFAPPSSPPLTRHSSPPFVIPAKAGIQNGAIREFLSWLPRNQLRQKTRAKPA